MIRLSKLSDLEQINVLGESLHPNFARNFHLETEIDSSIGIVLVSEDNGLIDGFLYALRLIDNIDLLSIVVAKEKRCQHIGSQLLSYLIENYCYQNNSITLEVAVNNYPALALYEKFGFKVVNRRVGYYNGTDAYLMKRDEI